MPPTLTLPYRGSKAMLRLGGTWITSKYKAAIRGARWTSKTKTYMMNKYSWDDATYDSVYWALIGAVRSRISRTMFMQTSKIMHDWLPTMHMQSHYTGNAQCPGCSCQKETIGHMLQCPHKDMAAKRTEVTKALRQGGRKAKVPSRIMAAVTEVIDKYLQGKDDYRLHITSIHYVDQNGDHPTATHRYQHDATWVFSTWMDGYTRRMWSRQARKENGGTPAHDVGYCSHTTMAHT